MKRILNLDTEFDVLVNIEYDEYEIAAGTYKNIDVPDGDLMLSEKGVDIPDQVKEDYYSFIESIEELLTDYYDLKIYYTNQSEDYSKYYGMIAKNDAGEIITKFKFKLRISNHPADRTNISQQHKKEEQQALNKLVPNKKFRPIVKCILVNRDQFDSYEEAIEYIYEKVEKVVEIMKR